MDMLHFKAELLQGSPRTFTMKPGRSAVFSKNRPHTVFLLEVTIFLEIIVLHEGEDVMGCLYNHLGSSY